jgi:hypothetical protein
LDPDLGPRFGTLPFGTPIWDHEFETPIWDPDLGGDMEPRFETPVWDPDLGPLILDPDSGPRFGKAPFGTPIWDPYFGP